MKKRLYGRFTLIIYLLLISLFLIINSASTIRGYSSMILRGDVEYLVVEDLEIDVIYIFSVTYDSAFWSYDVGFSIYRRSY